METAIWKGNLIIAYDVSQNYETEKEIRLASGRRQLCCPDPDCQRRALKYCHGEIKEAYFAHIDNQDCDYAKFDSEYKGIMKKIRTILYEHFSSLGYKVTPEVKLLPHHYTHLLVETDDKRKIAIEIATQRISANQIENLAKQYRDAGVSPKWIVLGNAGHPVKENETFFVKRYALNESKNKDLIVVNHDGTCVAQYKVDSNRYAYRGYPCHQFLANEMYTEYRTLSELIIEDDELTFNGFHQRYSQWLSDKQASFDAYIKAREEEEAERARRIAEQEAQRAEQAKREAERRAKAEAERIARIRLESEKRAREAAERARLAREYARKKEEQKNLKSSLSTQECVEEDEDFVRRRQSVYPWMYQQIEPVYDSIGARWIRCEECNTVNTTDKFSSYGGAGHVNLGICSACERKKRNIKIEG